jgi:hypothetical protein
MSIFSMVQVMNSVAISENRWHWLTSVKPFGCTIVGPKQIAKLDAVISVCSVNCESPLRNPQTYKEVQ